MDLTPIDLKKQEFKRVLRGYDTAQVRRFLDDVADTWEDLIRAREAMQERVAELAETIDAYRRMERTLNETLLAAQRIAEESREASMKEAEIVRKEAEMEGQRTLERAEAEAQATREQIRELRVERDNLFLRLRNLLEEELLRLHALRDAHVALPGPAPGAPSLSPPEGAERKAVIPPPAGARDLLGRPVGLPEPAEASARHTARKPEGW